MLHEIKGHSDYLISERGEVYNTKTKRYLKSSDSNTGYLTVYVDGKNRLLHRLIAETFIDNPNNLPCINHIDGNKQNNSIDNLEWCSYGENNLHAYKTGLKSYPFTGRENSPNHKLTESDVTYIKTHYKKHDKEFGGRALAKKFNVAESCISNLIHGRSWGGV